MYNHNYRYKGQLYHLQTECNGTQVVSHLFREGEVLLTQREDYVPSGEQEAQDASLQQFMQQHRSILRQLRDGELDAKLGLAAANSETTFRQQETASFSAVASPQSATAAAAETEAANAPLQDAWLQLQTYLQGCPGPLLADNT